MRNTRVYYLTITFLLSIAPVLTGQTLVSSGLPIVVLETDGKTIPSEPKIDIWMGIIDNPGKTNYITDRYLGYYGMIGIETRGSSSASFPKKNYGFETREIDGSNRNVSLMGLPAENDWIFYPPYNDKTLVRNPLTYHLARQMGYYAPRTRFCELMLDNQYQGIYILTERIKQDKNRVDIATLNPGDITGDQVTGGYIIKVDKGYNSLTGWTSSYQTAGKNIHILYHYPKWGDIKPQQKQYIQSYMRAFEDALASSNFTDPVSGYRALVDVTSFADYYLLSEYSKNIDAYRISTYMHKDKDSKGGKLVMGPYWDYDLAWGNANYYKGETTTNWMAQGFPEWDNFQIPFWWKRLLQDPSFVNLLKCRWEAHKNTVFKPSNIHAAIDSMVNEMGAAVGRNFQKWPVLGEYVWPNPYVGATHADEINYLKQWIQNRYTWIDKNLPGTCVTSETGLIEPKAKMVAYPNPFHSYVQVVVHSGINTGGRISIYNATGNMIFRDNLQLEPGMNIYRWESQDVTGNSLPEGVYLLVVESGGERASLKLVKR